MKTPLIIGVSALALLTLSATLFAQTATGSSLITQMKAAVHDFTLATDLNPGVTDLKSGPVSGKKTGDMLTAEEYNRILELVGQGGGVATECSGFQAYRNYTTISSLPPSDIINFTTEHFDKLGEFNPVTGIFTAKSDGLYIFTAEANPQAGFDFSSQVGLRIFKKNPPTYVIASNEHNVGGSVTVMSVARLYAGDQVFSSSNVGNGTFPVLHRFAGVRVDCGGGSSGGSTAPAASGSQVTRISRPWGWKGTSSFLQNVSDSSGWEVRTAAWDERCIADGYTGGGWIIDKDATGQVGFCTK